MPGTKSGGQKAALTNKRRYGKDYYVNIGKIGGKLGKTGGFYKNRELASIAGRKGGSISRRTDGTSRQSVWRRKKRLDYEGTRDHLDVTDRRS